MPDIIADFHGTLYADADEGPLWKYVAKRAVKDSIPYHPVRLVHLAKAKPVLEGLMQQYERGEIGYDRIYEAYNRLVLVHVPAEEAIRYIIDFASESKGKLQEDMMGPIADAPGLKGILSTGSRDLINHSINHPVSRYWTIEANSVMPSGKNAKGSALFLRVYENKPRWIQETFYDTQAFDPRNTVYLGDNADEEPAFEYVTASGGRIVMPFLASEDFKQHCAEKYRAEVPKDERELRLLLK